MRIITTAPDSAAAKDAEEFEKLGNSALEAYEEKLGLVQKFLDNRRDVGAIRTLAERIRTTQDLSLLNEISALAQRIEDR